MPSAPRRPRYFSGQLLTAEDFEAEQAYHVGARRMHNRHLHGAGVVCGLTAKPSSSGGVIVEPGLAIDSLGREIVVPHPHEMPDPRQAPSLDAVTICLAYAERPEGDVEPARFVVESYTLAVHAGCEGPCVPIATVCGSSGELEISGSTRPVIAPTQALHELVLSLAQRVEALEQRLPDGA